MGSFNEGGRRRRQEGRVNRGLAIVLGMAAALAGASSLAQDAGSRKPEPQMSREARERLREDLDGVNRDAARGGHAGRRRLSQQERERLREDLQDANEALKRGARRR